MAFLLLFRALRSDARCVLSEALLLIGFVYAGNQSSEYD